MKQAFLENVEKDIWTVCDRFRGAIMQEDYKFHYLSMITLKYLSENTDHSFNIPISARWDNLTSNSMDIGIRFEQAFEEIEKSNELLKGVFSYTHFKDINDQALFNIATSILDKYDFCISSEKQNSLAEDFTLYVEKTLELFTQREGAKGGVEASPEEIRNLLVTILDVHYGNIYDGTAGLNGFLIQAYKQAIEKNGFVHLFGQEANMKTWALGKMNLILHGLYADVAEVKCGDTIINPFWRDVDGNLMKFDGILSNPPFGISNWGYEVAEKDLYNRFKFGMPSKSSGDWAFISHFIASLNERGKAALVVPHGVLFRGAKEGTIRKRVIQEDLIEAVIGLPSNLFNNTSIPVAILVINKSKEESLKNKILIINAEDDFEKERVKNILRSKDIAKIADTYLNRKTIDGYSTMADIETISENEYNLLPFRYFDKIEVETEFGNASIFKETYENLDRAFLGEVATLQRGINITKKEIDEDYSTCLVINLADVDPNGEIIFENLKGANINSKRLKEYMLVPGDILISSRGTRKTKVVVVPDTEKTLIFSSNFIRLKLHNNNEYDPYFIKLFMDGPLGQYYVKSYQKGSMVTVLSAKDIEKISIPKISYNKQVKISRQMLQLQQEYEKSIREAEEKKKRGFMEGYNLMGLNDSFELI